MLKTCTASILDFVSEYKKYERKEMHLYDGIMQVNLRIMKRFVQDDCEEVLSIVGMFVKEPFRGKGIFSRFLQEAHRANPTKYTFVENVYEDRLKDFLIRNGFKVIDKEGYVNLYLEKDKTLLA